MQHIEQDEQVTPVDADLLIDEDKANTMEQVKDLERLGDIIGNWVLNTRNSLYHVLDMPENPDPENPDNGIMVNDPQHPQANEQGFRALNEAERNGFMFGIQYFVEEYLDKFPIKFLPTDADGNVPPEYASRHVGGSTGEDNAPVENKEG